MTVLQISGVTKRFGSLVANSDISLTLAEGEVLALLGENGAGKTTLMNILFGHYMADEGGIQVFGQDLPPGQTDAAIKAGVGMVHQHFTLAENMTVLENIMLGTEPLFSLRSATGRAKAKLRDMAEQYGLAVDPDARVGDLSVGERQRVEILKVLYRDARILILDEPTAVLTPQEVDQLFETLRSMVAKGLSIIFISHKLHEILAITDRVCVLRRGELVGEIATADADRDRLAEMMVGRQVKRPDVDHMAPGAPVLELGSLGVDGSSGHRAELANINLTIHQHEIIGLAGVAGNGQSALARVLSGMQAPDRGSISIAGDKVTDFRPTIFMDLGVGRIPEDRHTSGTVGEMLVWENLISEHMRQAPFWRMGGRVIDFAAARDFADKLIEEYDVRCRSKEMPARLLSGGNIQKLILARVLDRNPRFILANQPVRGLDEGAIATVHERLLDAKRNGAGVLLVSEDLDELLRLADRIVVMYHGEMSEPVSTRDLSPRDVGVMMAGDLSYARQLNSGAAA